MYEPEAIRRRKKREIDHEVVNQQRIVDNALVSKLRTLKVIIIKKGNFHKIYNYDVIIPKYHKAEEVSEINQNMNDALTRFEDLFNPPKKKKKYDEFEEILATFDKQSKNLSPLGYKNITTRDKEDDLKITQRLLKTSQLLNVENDNILKALIADICFKTMGKVKPKFLLRAQDGRKIKYLSEIKRDKYIFMTDAHTLNKTPDKMRELIQSYEKYIAIKRIKPFNLLDEFSYQYTTNINLKELREDSVMHSSFVDDSNKPLNITEKLLNPKMPSNTIEPMKSKSKLGTLEKTRDLIMMQNLQSTPHLSQLIYERNQKKYLTDLTPQHKFAETPFTHRRYKSSIEDLKVPYFKDKKIDMLKDMPAPKNTNNLLTRQNKVIKMAKHRSVIKDKSKRETEKMLKVIDTTMKRQKEMIVNNALTLNTVRGRDDDFEGQIEKTMNSIKNEKSQRVMSQPSFHCRPIKMPQSYIKKDLSITQNSRVFELTKKLRAKRAIEKKPIFSNTSVQRATLSQPSIDIRKTNSIINFLGKDETTDDITRFGSFKNDFEMADFKILNQTRSTILNRKARSKSSASKIYASASEDAEMLKYKILNDHFEKLRIGR
ncbi:unnamed protein product [Moneuplotes crassus]|uniref:Uncharacterized protein n=1 Tax=Euplotes crassus TaxID=5936 RepID=A0AAD1X7L3_EUPCR|nr:unnamed protein product [Moneuplotes crassus]